MANGKMDNWQMEKKSEEGSGKWRPGKREKGNQKATWSKINKLPTKGLSDLKKGKKKVVYRVASGN